MTDAQTTENNGANWEQVLAFLKPKPPLFCPEEPSITQTAFLRTMAQEAFFGGRSGGGKSSALLMAALQYVDVPGYSAILFRRTYSDLSQQGALMDRFKTWMATYEEVRWDGQNNRATFPSGARITFGYLNNKDDFERYRGPEFQFIGFDEVTEIEEHDYRFMFSRLRKPKTGELSKVPLRVRSTSNPAPGWVRQHFIVEGTKNGIIFVPSSVADNPGVDIESYMQSLSKLDPIEQKRQRDGDWWATNDGSMFKRDKIRTILRTQVPTASSPSRYVRFWDLAGTAATKDNRDPVTKEHRNPDWTVGTLCMFEAGALYVINVVRDRLDSDGVQELVKSTAEIDGRDVAIRMYQDPAQAGKDQISNYARYVIPGYDFEGVRIGGDKELLARPLSALIANSNCFVVESDWNSDWFDEISGFPESGDHDDQVDSVVGAFRFLAGLGIPQRRALTIIV